MVDVANVMGARADGWWRDRAAAALRLCREVMALAARGMVLPGTGLPGAGPPSTGPPSTGPSDEQPAAAWVLVLEGRARGAAQELRDAAARAAASAAPVRVVSAPASGDDAIVGVVAEVTATGADCLVVTADRELRRRCEAFGAAIVGPAWLLSLL